MKTAYLLINFFTIFFPVALSFDKRVQFYKSWKFFVPGMLITGALFLYWDALFTRKQVWFFNSDYIIGIKFFGLPIEEILFFLTVPFACLFIYACLDYYVKWQPTVKASRVISFLLIILSVILLVSHTSKLYTLVTFGLLAAVLLDVQFVLKAPWTGRFYQAYVVCLVPFYIINGILTAVPVVLYNNAENLHFRVGTIPFEDHFYLMSLLLMNTAFFEHFKRKWISR